MSEPQIQRKGSARSLAVTGAVDRSVEIERTDGPLIDAIDRAGPQPSADHATVFSGDGLFQASIPLARLRAASLHDGRIDMTDPPTRCWLVKDVVRIELTEGRQPDSLPPEERAKT
ncbi:MAG: hypothetical protein ACR2QE_11510 [Acidimicrobiales bacterium]